MTNEMKFAVCDYSATGEGRTICILITYLHPRRPDDYEIEPFFDYDDEGKMRFNSGTLKSTEEQILYREFSEIFGGYMAQGMEILTRQDFIDKFGRLVPEFVIKSIEQPMGNFHYFASIHYNLC